MGRMPHSPSATAVRCGCRGGVLHIVVWKLFTHLWHNVILRNRSMEIDKEIFDGVEDALPDEFQSMSAEGIAQRARLLENELRVLRDESSRLTLDQNGLKEKIKENKV